MELERFALIFLRVIFAFMIFCFLSLAAHLVFAAPQIVATEAIPDSQNQWVFINIDVDQEHYEYIDVAPAKLQGAALQAYVNNNEKRYTLFILRNIYLGAPEITTLDKMREWIAAGAKVKIKEANPITGEMFEREEIIKPVKPRYRHPERIKAKAELEKATGLEKRVEIIERFLKLK